MATDKGKPGFDPLAWMKDDAGSAEHPLGFNVEALESSFNAISPKLDNVITRFYEELFKRYPDVVPLFANTTPDKQQKKLSAALKLVINNLNNIDALTQALTSMGERHQAYGAEPGHYGAVASTLLDVMKEQAGDVWTDEVHKAWSHALEVIANVMLGAYSNSDADVSAAEPVPSAEEHPLGLNVAVLTNSFNLLAPKAEAMVAKFYAELFSRYPDVKPLFANTTPEKQQQKLLAALSLVIDNLNNIDVLSKALTGLGQRHQKYGVEPAHYQAVATTLLDVMKEYAGAAWTPEVHAAWNKALEVIASVMLGAYSKQEDKTMAASTDAMGGLGNVTVMDDMDLLKDMLDNVPINVMIDPGVTETDWYCLETDADPVIIRD